jgi:hypothetical protein
MNFPQYLLDFLDFESHQLMADERGEKFGATEFMAHGPGPWPMAIRVSHEVSPRPGWQEVTP